MAFFGQANPCANSDGLGCSTWRAGRWGGLAEPGGARGSRQGGGREERHGSVIPPAGPAKPLVCAARSARPNRPGAATIAISRTPRCSEVAKLADTSS